MASKNPHFRLHFKSGRKYRVVIVDHKETIPQKTPFGEEFFGRDRLLIRNLWDQLKPLVGKDSIGFEIQRV